MSAEEDKLGVCPDQAESNLESDTPFSRIWNLLGEGKQGISEVKIGKGKVSLVRSCNLTESGEIIPAHVTLWFDKLEQDWSLLNLKVGSCYVRPEGVTSFQIMQGWYDKDDSRWKSMNLREALFWLNEEALENVQQSLASSLADFLESQVSASSKT